MASYIRSLLVSLVFLSLSTLGTIAYAQDAQLQGQVLDPSGAGVPKALVRVVDQRIGTEAKVETNNAGEYTVPALNPGLYKVFVQAAGFSTAASDAITLAASQNAVLNFTLQVGANSTEVIVTAEKREENLLNVPVPVTPINADKMASDDQVRIRDFTEMVPSFNVAPENFNQETLSIRGITTGGFTLPTVGTTIDGVPYGTLLTVADVDPGDLARVEVLRGPQGTFYGANTMGGLVNFVTKEPSFGGFHGRFEVGSSAVSNGGHAGYNFRASTNVPVNNTLALRLSGFARGEPGYIDNPVYKLRDLNGQSGYGGRVAILWSPLEAFSMKLSALYDHLKSDGSSWVNVQPGVGDLQQNYVANTGGAERSIEAYSATIRARIANIDLVSLTGSNNDYGRDSFDWSNTFGSLVKPVFGVTGAPFFDYARDTRVTEELRISSSSEKNFDWLIGGFYSDAHLAGYGKVVAAVPNTGQVLGTFWELIYPRNYKEVAAFGNFTYRFNRRFDVQVGGRESQDREYQSPYTQDGPYIGPAPITAAAVKSQTNAFTYLVTPRYKLSDDLMLYARFASGYRPGGPNTNAPGLPRQYNPDKTQNYETGLKGEFFRQRLSVDASLYYISWDNIQIQKFASNNLSFTTNGNSAKSQGVELSATVRPQASLTIAGWFAYDDAALTGAFPVNGPLYGAPGNRLPFSSRFSGEVSIDREFPLTRMLTGVVGVGANLVGNRVGVFTGTAQRQDLPGYAKVDLRAGVRHKSWTASIYVNNVADERGAINGGVGYYDQTAFLYINPRTVVLSLVKTF